MQGIRQNFTALRDIAKEQLGDKSSHAWKEPGNKYEHGIRTAKLAEKLRLAICPEDASVNPDVLTVAAWFHDLCNGQEDHERLGAEALPGLIGHLCTEEELKEVCSIVRVHDHRTAAPEKSPYSAAVRLLQDADMLDHLGAYDIWITFAEFTYKHKTPHQYTGCFHDGSFDRFEAHWRAKINYDFSLTVFDEKIRYEREFAARMERELDGELC
ncbi:MAG: HD domain-containing protein [Clostridia bacterium]|nr:HD domain-containing protein [Clostridia bacterium]